MRRSWNGRASRPTGNKHPKWREADLIYLLAASATINAPTQAKFGQGPSTRRWDFGGPAARRQATPTDPHEKDPDMSCTKAALVKFTVAATVLSAAALTVSAIPASASASALFQGHSFNQSIICTPPGTHGMESGHAFGFYYVANGCGTRIWLQGSTGWTFCISPYAQEYIPSWAQFPAKAGVSTNRAAC